MYYDGWYLEYLVGQVIRANPRMSAKQVVHKAAAIQKELQSHSKRESLLREKKRAKMDADEKKLLEQDKQLVCLRKKMDAASKKLTELNHTRPTKKNQEMLGKKREAARGVLLDLKSQLSKREHEIRRVVQKKYNES